MRTLVVVPTYEEAANISELLQWLRAAALQGIDYKTTHATGYLFQMEMAYRVAQNGEQMAEVPITFTDRVRGTSKMSGAVIFEEPTRVTWWGIRDRVRRLLHTKPRTR